jgi:hypothetical protein
MLIVMVVLGSKNSFFLVFHLSFDLTELRVVLVFNRVLLQLLESHGILNRSHSASDLVHSAHERTIILVIEAELPQESIIEEGHLGHRVDFEFLFNSLSVLLNLVNHLRHVEAVGSNELRHVSWGSTAAIRELKRKYVDVEGLMIPHLGNPVSFELVMTPLFNGIDRGDERLRRHHNSSTSAPQIFYSLIPKALFRWVASRT